MDHVINRRAVFIVLMGSTDKHVVIASSHLFAFLSCTNSKQLDYEQVELKNKLSNMLVLPDGNVHSLGKFADFLDVFGINS